MTFVLPPLFFSFFFPLLLFLLLRLPFPTSSFLLISFILCFVSWLPFTFASPSSFSFSYFVSSIASFLSHTASVSHFLISHFSSLSPSSHFHFFITIKYFSPLPNHQLFRYSSLSIFSFFSKSQARDSNYRVALLPSPTG